MGTDAHGLFYAPCSSVHCLTLNSPLQRVACENKVRVVAAELLQHIKGRRPEVGLGKRPAPIESDPVMRAGPPQLKEIAHADRGKSARQDRLGAGVAIHEIMHPAIAIGGSALDHVVDANLDSFTRLFRRMGRRMDRLMALARAGDGQSGRQQGALAGGDGEAHGFNDHLTVVAGTCGSR
jgi:predicted metallopeptidase